MRQHSCLRKRGNPHDPAPRVDSAPSRCHEVTIASATLTPEGIWVRYHGDAREANRHAARAWSEEIAGEVTELSITDDTGGTYLVPEGPAPIMSGRGGTLWAPEGEVLAVPSSGGAGSGGIGPAVRWLEFSAGSGQAARVEVLSPRRCLRTPRTGGGA